MGKAIGLAMLSLFALTLAACKHDPVITRDKCKAWGDKYHELLQAEEPCKGEVADLDVKNFAAGPRDSCNGLADQGKTYDAREEDCLTKATSLDGLARCKLGETSVFSTFLATTDGYRLEVKKDCAQLDKPQ